LKGNEHAFEGSIDSDEEQVATYEDIPEESAERVTLPSIATEP